MTDRAHRRRPLASILLAAVLGAAVAAPAVAQDDDGRKTKQTVAMSQRVYENLQAIQELVEANAYAEAHQMLEEMRQATNHSPYETAQIWNLTGYTYYLQERYADAVKAYENVLSQPELPEALQQSTLKTISQLYFTIEDYPKALETVNRLIAAVEEPSADVLMLKGQALFQMQRYEDAIEPIKTGIDMYRAQGNVPKENWLLLLRVCYYELGDMQSMLAVVKELIDLYPKDTYILTLAGIYSELEDTKKQLALTEVLYEKGYLTTPSHASNLANLYLMHGLPYKAATLLQKEIDSGKLEADERNLRLLSQAWYQAREDEKAIPPLERASAMSSDGELYIRLAQSHINLENWAEAAEAARKGIERGGLNRKDTAYILLGMALFNERKLEQARRAFQSAREDQRSARTAQQWIAYVDSEIRRRDTLEQDLPDMQPRQIDDILTENVPPSDAGE